jgi:hypothetical protein
MSLIFKGWSIFFHRLGFIVTRKMETAHLYETSEQADCPKR